MIKNVFLLYISGGILLVLWDMRYRILARFLRSQKYNMKANIESPLYVNDYGLARIKGIFNIIFIWPLRIYISAKRIFRNIVKKKTKKSNILEKFFDKLNRKLFPAGKKQRKEEAKKIIELSSGKLNFDEALNVLLGTSALFSIAEDKGEDRMLEYINNKANQKLNSEEAKRVLDFIAHKFIFMADTLELLSVKAQGFRKDGKLKNALACYNEAFDLLVVAADRYARNCQGAIVDKGKTRIINSKLFEEAKRYLKRDKLAAVISNAMGAILVELGDLEGAKKMFEQAIGLTPEGMDYINPKTNLKELEK